MLVDGNSLVYRAYHAMPHLTAPDSTPTGAVYGFTQTLRKLMREHRPTHMAVAFDLKGPTVRHALYGDYKIDRPPMPGDLARQIPVVKRVVEAMGVKVMEMEGYEADDIIATAVKALQDPDAVDIKIVSSDKDLCQLVGEGVVMIDAATGRVRTPEYVRGKFGVEPGRIPDWLGLAGDPADNIPGVPGIGPRTATRLIDRHGSIDDIYADLSKISGKKLRENLEENRDLAFLSKVLATVITDVPLDLEFEGLEIGSESGDLAALYAELGFERLLRGLRGGGDGPDIDYETIDGEGAFARFRSALAGPLAFYLDDAGGGALAFASAGGGLWYMPLGGEGPLPRGLASLMEDGTVEKVTDDAKKAHLFFLRRGVAPRSVVMDTSLASYLLDPSRSGHALETVALEHLSRSLAPMEGGEHGELSERARAARCCERASVLGELAPLLEARLEEADLSALLRSMELPLARILARMELAGVKVDTAQLEMLSREIEGRLAAIEEEIYRHAGRRFNINSPKQLSALLFGELGLKPLKKTKTGYSTDEGVLTALAPLHEVPRLIIEYRGLAKLKGTYVDALVALADPATGRIHTSLNQTVTATGRLSSSRPNLQNIPVRSELGRRIRRAFVAERGSVLLSADYSQIELRLVAHMSGDPALIEAFGNDEDIHTATAASVFGVPPAEVTSEMRRRAKAINFGIIYGMGGYGLARELGVAVAEAEAYIESYFAHYARVREFIERTVEQAGRLGWTTTLFGRRRMIPELASGKENVVRLGERMAVNTPVQGSAADIIKAAMIAVDGELERRAMRSRMVLQVHDELLFEAPADERDELEEIVRTRMEGVVRLDVPLKVNIGTGANWCELDG